MHNKRNKQLNERIKVYSTKFATLLTSTFLLLASAPIVSASEDIILDETNQIEEQYLGSDENEIDTAEESDIQMTTSSSVEDEILTDNQVEPADLIEPDTEGESVTIPDDENDELDEDNTGDSENDESDENETDQDDPEEETDEPEPEEPEEPGEPEPEEPEEPVEPEPEPEPEPEEPIPGDPKPDPEPEPEPEPIPDVTIDPILRPNPIQPNASTITGTANPNAHVIVIYPGTSRQRAATVDAEGNWIIRNVGGDSAYLTEGAEVPMQLQLMDNGREMTYSYAFQVGDDSATDLIEESQTVYVPNGTETASVQNSQPQEESDAGELEVLPPTGEEDNLDMLGFASIAAGLSLIVIGKTKKEQV